MEILGLNNFPAKTLIEIIKSYKKKRVIIVGQTCSGKDHLKKALLENGFHSTVSYTTRPPRESEKDGIDYFFVDESTFETYAINGFFREWDSFNGYKYGTTFTEWNAINPDKVYIMTPNSVVTCLTAKDRASSLFIFLQVNPELQLRRLYNRGLSKQEVDQRLDEEEAVMFFAHYNWNIRIKDLNIV